MPTAPATRTRFIAFEGLDGAGKTTQLELLRAALAARGEDVSVYSFPSYDDFFGREVGTLLAGESGRSAAELDPRSTALWYALDRWEVFGRRPPASAICLLNRWSLSNAAYQSARVDDEQAAAELYEWILELEHRVLGLPRPELTLYFDVAANLAVERAEHREGSRGARPDVYERSHSLQGRVRNAYLAAAQTSPGLVVFQGHDEDTGQPKSRDALHAEVLAVTDAHFG